MDKMAENVLKKEIGQRVKNLRMARGESQEKFANLVGLTTQYLSCVERGSNGLTIAKALNICEVTNTTLDYLIKGEAKSELLQFIWEKDFAHVSIEQMEKLSKVILEMVGVLKSHDADKLLEGTCESAVKKR